MGYWLTRKEERLLLEIYKHGSGGMIWEKSDEMETLSVLDLVDPVCPCFGESGETRVFLTEAGQGTLRYLQGNAGRKHGAIGSQRRLRLPRWWSLLFR